MFMNLHLNECSYNLYTVKDSLLITKQEDLLFKKLKGIEKHMSENKKCCNGCNHSALRLLHTFVLVLNLIQWIILAIHLDDGEYPGYIISMFIGLIYCILSGILFLLSTSVCIKRFVFILHKIILNQIIALLLNLVLV